MHAKTYVVVLALVAALLALPASRAAADPAGAGTGALGRQAGLLDAGDNHTCAVFDDGTVRCWGAGGFGRLGYGNTSAVGDDETPASVGTVDLGSGRTATAISAGSAHTCALLDDGNVRCWGAGGFGRLGRGNTNDIGDDETPASVGTVDLGTGRTATAISAGSLHTCALLDDGNVRCWGYGNAGRLGYGNTNDIGDNETPASVGTVDLGTGRTATAISAGGAHTCALLDDGNVRCWGLGGVGQLGYGNTDNIGDNETPASVGTVDLGTGRTATAISAGSLHTCALLDDGNVRCWGSNDRGQVGLGSTTNIGDDEPPGGVGPLDLGAGRTATAITANGSHACALLDDGTVRCWGRGNSGQLGYGNPANIGDDEAPGSVGPVNLGTGRTATAVTTGSLHTCALLDDGAVRCWGAGTSGQLGYGNTADIGDNEAPGSVGPVTTGGLAPTTASPVTAVGATAGDGSAAVSWTAPTSNGGSAITGYHIGISPSGATRTAGAGATSFTVTGLTNGTAYTFTVRALTAAGASRGARSSAVTPAAAPPVTAPAPTTTTLPVTPTTAPPPPPPPVTVGRPSGPNPRRGVVLSDGSASWTVDPSGHVTVTGTAAHVGDVGRRRLNAPIVAIATTPDRQGYWLLAADGGVFSFGTATFHGSLGGRSRRAPLVDLVPTPTGRGYLLLDAAGRVYAFGDAHHLGDRAGRPLAAPAVGLTRTTSGRGYWLLGRDGGVFTFGDARFYGSGVPRGRAATTLVPSDRGAGYWIVDDRGTSHAFGDVKGL